MSSFISAYCVSAYLIHSHSKGCDYLLLRRVEDYLKGTWQMISGGIKEGEKAYEAALRETFEETGLKPLAFTLLMLLKHFICRSKI
jgi:dihydroneopterin triphosphate diphosphatase